MDKHYQVHIGFNQIYSGTEQPTIFVADHTGNTIALFGVDEVLDILREYHMTNIPL